MSEFAVMRAMAKASAEQNLIQKQVAKRTGIAQAAISKLENGRIQALGRSEREERQAH